MSDAMVTARMSRGKKEAGAVVLGRLGTTPSRAINELYDYVIHTGALPFEDARGSRTQASSRPERLAEARSWLDGASLPADNRFAGMDDEAIRRERLASRGL